MNDNIKTLPTEYAPAELADEAKLEKQIKLFQELPYFKSIVDSYPNIYLILNANRQIVYANQTAQDALKTDEIEQINGLRPGDAVQCANSLKSPGGCGTSEFCRHCGAVNAILSSLKGKEDVQECRIVRTDGDALDFRVWTKPMEMEGEQYTVFTIADISDEKRRHALERIFFHDIINTAGTLRGFAQIILDDPEQAKEFKQYLYTLSNRLIDEIMAQKQLLAAENNELKLSVKAVDTKEILDILANEYKNHNVGQNKFVQLDSTTVSTEIKTDPALLMRVIGNMIKNALEAITESQTVTVGCSMENNEVEFWVHNSVVMPDKVKRQIFQRSFSTKGSGRGLGTYSMKLLSEKYLKGYVSFVSDEEHGTIFSAHYPLDVNSNQKLIK